MKQRQWQNIFCVVVNTNSTIQYVLQIKSGKIKHVNVNVKIIISTEKIKAGILAHVYTFENSKYLKLASAIFYQIFIFHQMIAL